MLRRSVYCRVFSVTSIAVGKGAAVGSSAAAEIGSAAEGTSLDVSCVSVRLTAVAGA